MRGDIETTTPLFKRVRVEPDQTTMTPQLGKPAPHFKCQAVVNGEFKTIDSNDYKGKYVTLFFYPADFTFVCPTEIIAFNDAAQEFRDLGCELLACSTDSHFSHLAWTQQSRKEGGLGTMDIPLLADATKKIARDFGVLKEDEGVAYRGTFIMDREGILKHITVNDMGIGRSVEETQRVLQAIQFVEKHGEVCPSGWKPGAKTIKADPKGSKAYFSSEH